MSRDRVLNLRMLRTEGGPFTSPVEITLGGKPFPLRYDLLKFRRWLFDYSKDRILNATSFSKWLNRGDEIWPPVAGG